MGRRVGRPLGWAGTLSPRGPGMVFPLCCGSSLGLGWVTGQSGVIIVQVFTFGQGVGVTFGRTTTTAWQCEATPARPFDGAQGERPLQGMCSRLGTSS